jgi:hypothetical protein
MHKKLVREWTRKDANKTEEDLCFSSFALIRVIRGPILSSIFSVPSVSSVVSWYRTRASNGEHSTPV